MHDELKLFLIIYVDDFKLAGPTENLSKGWKLLRKHIDIEEEKDGGVFLGCNQERSEITLPNGRKAGAMTYSMKGFMESCVARYIELAQPKGGVGHAPHPLSAGG